jgi:hypothetical protein
LIPDALEERDENEVIIEDDEQDDAQMNLFN